MTRPKPRTQAPATATTLSHESEERIHKFVLRAVQCGFGAEPTLRRAVQLGANEMLKAGASFPVVRQAIAECVLSHPSVLPDKLSLMTGESYASAILKRMLAWTDDVVLASDACDAVRTRSDGLLRNAILTADMRQGKSREEAS